MDISEKNEQYLHLLMDIYDISTSLHVRTYIWGGMSIDIWENRFIREHGDLDGFTEKLIENLDALTVAYENRGYTASFEQAFSMLTSPCRQPVGICNPHEIHPIPARFFAVIKTGCVDRAPSGVRR